MVWSGDWNGNAKESFHKGGKEKEEEEKDKMSHLIFELYLSSYLILFYSMKNDVKRRWSQI